jgi:hypothetical protein
MAGFGLTLIENSVIRPGLGASPIRWPHRVLLINREAGVASVIALPGAPSKNGKPATHVGGPKQVPLEVLEDALSSNALAVTNFEAPGHWSMTDEEYLLDAPTDREKGKRVKRLAARDAAWEMIGAIIGNLSIREIAADPVRLRPKVLKQAKDRDLNPTTVYRSLHIYLASGGVRSSLIPNTHLRGAPGREKVQTSTKLGRKSRLEKAGEAPEARYVLTPQDKLRLANGYALRGKGRTVEDAYLLTCGVFWSTLAPDKSPRLLPAHERPTEAEFKYWGKKLNASESRKKRIGSDAWSAKVAAGSTQDQVCAVGQMAMIDSTSTDVYLVSTKSRLVKLPPMHRTIVKEIRSTAVIGICVSWEDPSAATALQAILSSTESKVDICARFGITIREEDWPSLLCKLYLADNGEMKAAFITEAEKEFRFGVEYVKAYSGQSKSDVENQHHTDHKRLDHKVPGNTGGRQRERGEDHPADDALWNYFEYMREFLLMVIGYNNEEVPHLAPTAMLKEGVAPTRINILKWMMARNMRADIPCNVDQLRGYTLPTKTAVMTKTGIRLLMPDGIRHVPQLRFFAPELKTSHHFAEAVKKGGSVPIKIKYRDDDLSHIWFALPSGLTRIPNVSSDAEFIREATLVDHLRWTASEDLRKDKKKPEEDQAKLNTLLRREGITGRAKKEARQERAALPKKPSKKEARSELRRKRDEEMATLQAQSWPPPEQERTPSDKAFEAEPSQATSDAMDKFMEAIT